MKTKSNFIFTVIFVSTIILLIGCSKDSKYWEKAKSLNSIQSYVEYISIYPNGKYYNDAKFKIDSLRKSLNIKCLIIMQEDKSKITSSYIEPKYIGEIMFRLNAWYEQVLPVEPSIYLYRDGVSTEDKKLGIKKGIIYMFLADNKIVNLGSIDTELTDEQIAQIFYIDFSNPNKSKNINSNDKNNSVNVRVSGEKWISKGIFHYENGQLCRKVD